MLIDIIAQNFKYSKKAKAGKTTQPNPITVILYLFLILKAPIGAFSFILFIEINIPKDHAQN